MPMSVSSRAAMRSASAGDDKVGHVGYRLVAEGGVDLVRGRVRLVGEQAGPRAFGLDLPGNLGDCVAGPAASALGRRRVHRGHTDHPERGRADAGEMHPLSGLADPEPQLTGSEPTQYLRTVG